MTSPDDPASGVPQLPRFTEQWVICEDTGIQARFGHCLAHGGDACLIVVRWCETIREEPPNAG